MFLSFPFCSFLFPFFQLQLQILLDVTLFRVYLIKGEREFKTYEADIVIYAHITT